MLEQALWLSMLGAGLGLDTAMVGLFMVSQPLVVGGLFGWLLGDLGTGLIVGAMVQLLWIGVLPVGAYVPSDHTITGGITAALTVYMMKVTGLALGPSLVIALSVAIPAGVLSGKMDILVRHLNSRIAAMGEQVAERHGMLGIDGLNLAGLVAAFFRNFFIYFIWLGPLALLLKILVPHIPQQIIGAAGFMYWILPMLSFGVVLEMISKEQSRWMIAGVFIAAWLCMWLWADLRMFLFGAILIGGAIAAWWKRAW